MRMVILTEAILTVDIHMPMAETTQSDLPLLRLMQLVSPSLPIGGFTYSQGMEWAVEDGILNDEQAVLRWMLSLMEDNLLYVDLPVIHRLYNAFSAADAEQVNKWSDYLHACRESRELREEEINRARALTRLLTDLEIPTVKQYNQALQTCHLAGFALASWHWQISIKQVLLGYSWSWIENQVAAAIKLVPLGQTAGQKLQLMLTEAVPDLVEQALTLSDDDLGGSAPMLAIASSRHETQYTRLFRS